LERPISPEAPVSVEYVADDINLSVAGRGRSIIAMGTRSLESSKPRHVHYGMPECILGSQSMNSAAKLPPA
jgi:hypothetical protein